VQQQIPANESVSPVSLCLTHKCLVKLWSSGARELESQLTRGGVRNHIEFPIMIPTAPCLEMWHLTVTKHFGSSVQVKE